MTRRLVAVLLGALVVGGCSAEADPTPEPSSVTTAPSPEQTTLPTRPAVTAPEPPAEMSRSDAEGAKAAAEYFLSLVPYVYATGDLGPWDAISEPDCTYCGSIADDVTSLHQRGGFVDGAEISLGDSTAHESEPGTGVFRVQVQIAEADSLRYEGLAATPTREEGGDYSVQLIVLRHEEGWTIRGAEVDPL